MKSIPKLPKVSLDELNAKFLPNTAMEQLGIRVTAVNEDSIEATMPVDHRTHQPYGFLHGGASALLAETLASLGANMLIDTKTQRCFGLELNANHVGSVREGVVTGRATPLHVGRSTQVWDIRMTSDTGKLVCVSRLTLSVTDSK